MNGIVAADLKQAAAGRWTEILSSVAGIPQESLDGRPHPCPKCEGTDRFRFIDDAAGAAWSGSTTACQPARNVQ